MAKGLLLRPIVFTIYLHPHPRIQVVFLADRNFVLGAVRIRICAEFISLSLQDTYITPIRPFLSFKRVTAFTDNVGKALRTTIDIITPSGPIVLFIAFIENLRVT